MWQVIHLSTKLSTILAKIATFWIFKISEKSCNLWISRLKCENLSHLRINILICKTQYFNIKIHFNSINLTTHKENYIIKLLPCKN